MMLLDVFNLFLDFAEKVANQPDEPIEYLDQHMADFSANKEYAERFKNIVYPNQDASKIPNSEAQKKLHQILMYFVFLNEFAKYLDERAAGVREQRRQMLIAIAIMDALLTHQAMIAQFWETLSDQYIQYLADRLTMLGLMSALIPLYQQQAAVQQQIAAFDRQIKELDGKILRAESFLDKRYNDLIQLSQSRLDAVNQVTQNAIHDNLGVLALGAQNLSDLVTTKRSLLQRFEQEFKNYKVEDPHDKAGKKADYLAQIEKAEKELEISTIALEKFETRSEELHTQRESIRTEIIDLKQKFLDVKDLEEKKSYSELLANKTTQLESITKDSSRQTQSIISDVYRHDLQNFAGVDNYVIEKMMHQIQDVQPRLAEAMRTNADEISFKMIAISKATDELTTFKTDRAEVVAQRTEKEEEENELKKQIKEGENKLHKLTSGDFDFSKLRKDSLAAQASFHGQLHKRDDAKPAIPTPHNTSRRA